MMQFFYPNMFLFGDDNLDNYIPFMHRFYAYQQQILLSDTFHVKSLSDSKEHIKHQISLLNIPRTNDHHYIYFYVIKMDDKWCMKIGRTINNLYDMINKYLFVEHFTQKKDIETFKNSELAEISERIIKEGLKNYPLNINQYENTEQYLFMESWELLKKYIQYGFVFSSDGWVHPHLDNEINIITNRKIID
jgi:hypothetical protein